MKDDKETKVKLIESAKQEFMEKGYMQASLRNICKNAEVTTGALYFFFKDKEDLFASLVEEVLNELFEMMNHHYQYELNNTNGQITETEYISNDLLATKQAISYMYKHYDEFQLLITKSQGSKFEHFIDEFVEITEKHYSIIADRISKQRNIKKMDEYMIHWVSHMHIDAFVYLITHEKSEEKALKNIESIIKYLFLGWNGMFE